jgi:hypothetical protein
MSDSIQCETCGAPIPSANIELALMIAKCDQCNAVFSFAGQVGHSDQDAVNRVLGGAQAPVRPVPSDHKVRESDTGDQLILTLRWFTPKTLFIAFFALFWNGFLVVWYTMGLAGLASGETGMIIMLLFPVLHVIAGAYLAYTAITGFVNATTVTVSRRGVDVRHGPLPWPGNKTLSTEDIAQLYVSPRQVSSKNSTQTVYDVTAVGPDNLEVVLVKGIENDNAALFMERRIETWLGIEDREVPGQHL